MQKKQQNYIVMHKIRNGEQMHTLFNVCYTIQKSIITTSR